METNEMTFRGSIPEIYEGYLGPFLFEPFAGDLVDRVPAAGIQNILELACGTGRVTRRLLEKFPDAQLIATDINRDMLSVANDKTSADNVHWEIADMADIPYANNLFDLVACQFGLMLVENKQKALNEMLRVLKKGGRLLFSVWGNARDNQVWDIGLKVMRSFFSENLIPANVGPFSMQDKPQIVQLLEQSGFRNTQIHSVTKTGVIESAELAVKGLIDGSPISLLIMQKDPSLIDKIKEAYVMELTKQLGNHPLQSSLQAWLVEAVK